MPTRCRSGCDRPPLPSVGACVVRRHRRAPTAASAPSCARADRDRLALIAAMLMAFVALRRVGTSLSIAPVCYGADSLHAQRVVATGGDPEQACAAAVGRRPVRAGAVPDFDVCVLRRVCSAVFPGEAGSVCSRLDLPRELGRQPRRAVRRRGQPPRCRRSASSRDQAAADRRTDEIATRGLAGWKAEVGAGWDDPKRTVCVDRVPTLSTRHDRASSARTMRGTELRAGSA